MRWPLFGFLIAVADPELSEATERLKASGRKDAPQDPESLARAQADEAAVTEALVGWRRHDGVVRVASRVGWVIVVLDVVRLLVMVPLYLAEQVAALGVAKIVLGWPAYLVAVLVIGLLLLRGHTPLERPTRGPARLTPTGRRRSAGSLVAAGEAVAGGEHLLEDVLALRRGDEEQLVVRLDRVVAARGDRAVVADDPDEHGVVGPVDLGDALADVGTRRRAWSARPSTPWSAGTGRSARGRRR